jgi:hypothetical protein
MSLLLEQLGDAWGAAKGAAAGLQGAKLALLSALQAQLVGVLTQAAGKGGERAALELDAKRCSENIVLGGGGRTATQKQSKSWGSVLASTGFAPNTGVHQWMVRLDRCEKGHVFIGVCTAEASTKTYVGGDRHGWGMIGTKALWHNRSKIRGDYGEGFGSRCVVRVRLDTDRGTLSLGQGNSADWGVAFEKLPKTEVRQQHAARTPFPLQHMAWIGRHHRPSSAACYVPEVPPSRPEIVDVPLPRNNNTSPHSHSPHTRHPERPRRRSTRPLGCTSATTR